MIWWNHLIMLKWHDQNVLLSVNKYGLREDAQSLKSRSIINNIWRGGKTTITGKSTNFSCSDNSNIQWPLVYSQQYHIILFIDFY